MGTESDPDGPGPDRSRRAFVKSVWAGLASLSLFSTTDAPRRHDAGLSADDGVDHSHKPTVNTALSFDSGAITIGETTTMTCEWEITTQVAPGGFHTLKAIVPSSTIDAPESVTEPFQPDMGWAYDTTGETVPIRGAMYRWSVRNRWAAPGTYRVQALIDPFYPGEITAFAGPYDGDHFDWAKETLSVKW